MDYKAAMIMVEGSKDPSQDVLNVNIEKAVSEELEIKPVNYEAALELMYGTHQVSQRAQAQVQQQTNVDSKKSEEQHVQQNVQPQHTILSIPIQQQKTQKTPPAPLLLPPSNQLPKLVSHVPDKERAAIESLQSIMNEFQSAMGRDMARVSEAVPYSKKSDAILPTLSVQDQISDLEKMIRGIDAKEFDRSQLEIIANEVHQLEKEVKENSVRAGAQDNDMVSLRNQRLASVINALSRVGM